MERWFSLFQQGLREASDGASLESRREAPRPTQTSSKPCSSWTFILCLCRMKNLIFFRYENKLTNVEEEAERWNERKVQNLNFR